MGFTRIRIRPSKNKTDPGPLYRIQFLNPENMSATEIIKHAQQFYIFVPPPKKKKKKKIYEKSVKNRRFYYLNQVRMQY